MEVRLAAPEDLDAFVGLLEDVARWFWDRGVRQWKPGSMREQAPRLERAIAAGEVHVLGDGATLIGAVVLDESSDGLWADLPGDACYVHKLAVARAYAGRRGSVVVSGA